ncbi:MAG: hypothetical protein RI568_13100 [Natronomonas sp.]|uniref:hypothetical protein n=1 Tax=Natronomonas sp. TaxID=2184060 RepID=UPI00286FE5FF|nr:hypothetical protein [Natronomonas sp.]MDR9431619.1 hypothetical protein [Natronomonas sp.]
MASAIETVANVAGSGLKRAKQAGESLNERKDGTRLFSEAPVHDRGVMNEVRMIGGALVAIVIIALVLTEVYNAVSIPNDSPFYGIVSSAESTGVAAITLLIVGLLVLSASVIMRFMGGSFAR